MAPTGASGHGKATSAKKARKLKKRDMPTRPLSAYNFFFREQRAKILEEREEEARSKGTTPDKTDLFAVLGKTIAARWKAQDESQRAKYKELAAEDMKRYRADMDTYHETIAKSVRVDDEGNDKKKTKKKRKGKKAADEYESVDGSQDEGKATIVSETSPSVNPMDSKTLPHLSAANGRFLPMPGVNAGGRFGIPGAVAGHAAPGLAGAYGLPQAGLGGTGLDVAAYQNLLHQRELAALREQQGLGLGTAGLGPQRLGMESLLRSGGTTGILGLMNGSGMSGSGSLGTMGLMGDHANRMVGGGTMVGTPYPGLDISELARSDLSPQQQLLLLRQNPPSADNVDLSIRQRLEMMQQQQQQARQMQHMMELQQQQLLPQGLAVAQERQRILERQRLQQLLAGMNDASGASRGF